MTFGSQVDESAAMRIVDRCLDLGVNFFDTANVYNNGASEAIVGKALKGRRDKLVLASKVRGKMGDGADENGLSRAAITRGIEDSLRRLQTDYLDLYYLHQPDYAVPIEESLEAMDRLVKQGKVRYAASSNYSGWQVCQMQWIAAKNAYKPATVTQPMYNLLARGIEQEYLPMCKEFGVSTVVYNPLAGGMLTGKQKPHEAPAERGRALRRQSDVPQPVLARGGFRRGRSAAGGRPKSGSLAGKPCAQLAATPHRDRLRDSWGLEN